MTDLITLLVSLILVLLICASVIPLHNYIVQMRQYKRGESTVTEIEYSYSPDLVNCNLDRLYGSNSAKEARCAYSAARSRGWIRGSYHVMDAEEFERKKAQEFKLQLP